MKRPSRKQHLREHDDYWEVMPSLKYTLPKAPAFQKRLDWIVKHAYGKVLDCGCNDGTFSIELAKRGFDVCGIDILPRLISRAMDFAIWEGVTDRVDFRVYDIENLRWRLEWRGVFNTVILTETLEHLVKPRRALKQIKKVMRPGGRLLVSVPNGVDKQPTHYNSFTPESLEALLQEFFLVKNMESDFGTIYCIARKETR